MATTGFQGGTGGFKPPSTGSAYYDARQPPSAVLQPSQPAAQPSYGGFDSFEEQQAWGNASQNWQQQGYTPTGQYVQSTNATDPGAGDAVTGRQGSAGTGSMTSGSFGGAGSAVPVGTDYTVDQSGQILAGEGWASTQPSEVVAATQTPPGGGGPASPLDPNFWMYGGSPTGAGDFASRVGQQGIDLSALGGQLPGLVQSIGDPGQQSSEYWRGQQQFYDQSQAANQLAQQMAVQAGTFGYRGQQAYQDARTGLGQLGTAMGQARMAATGQGPSQAQSVLRQGTDQALAAQMAAAQSGPGGWSAAGQRSAAMAGAAAQAQGAAQAGQLRAQEMLAARDQYGQLAGQYAGQLQALGTQQMAGAGQMADIYGAAAGLRANLAGQGLAAAGQEAQQRLAQQALQNQAIQGALGNAAGLYGLEQQTMFGQAELMAEMQRLQMQQYMQQQALAQGQSQWAQGRQDARTAAWVGGGATAAAGIADAVGSYYGSQKAGDK